MKRNHGKNKRRIFLIFLGILFLESGAALNALEIFPEHFALEGNAGEKIKNQIFLKNPGQETVKVNLLFLPCSADEKINRKKWVKFSHKTFKIKPRETKILDLLCKVPKKTKGELSGIVMIKTENPLDPFMEIRYLHPLTLHIKGTGVIKAKFIKVEAKKNMGAIFLNYSIKNEGNMRIKPKFVVEILNLKGELSSKVLEPKINEIKPEEQLSFTSALPLEGNYENKGTLKLFYKDLENKVQSDQMGFEVLF